MTYTIKIKQFEGPFDLLLFFIERDELDIYDIPIARIADDFLSYIREIEALNIDLASEFILVAATLMRIKAKMLLPRKELDEEGNEIDPRDELVRRLIEYKQYKAIISDLREMEEHRSQSQTRGNIADELQEIANKALVDSELESISLFKLLQAFQRVMERYEDVKRSSAHTIVQYSYTVAEQQLGILSILEKAEEPRNFESLFGQCKDRIHAIVTFLALLELLNHQKIALTMGLGPNNFWVYLKDEDEEE